MSAPDVQRLTQRPSFPILVIILVSLVASTATLFATARGIGIDVDSVKYLEAANNLATGHGFTTGYPGNLFVPLSTYPPLYPTLLALGRMVGVPVQSSARWLNVILSGLNIFLFGFILTRDFPDAFWLPVLGSLILAVADGYYDIIHAVAMTEALFLCFCFSGLYLFAAFLKSTRWQVLAGASMLIGLACLTRYAGLALLLTVVLVIGLHYGRLSRAALSSVLTVSLFGFVPVLGWLVYDHIAGTDARILLLHVVPIAKLGSGLVNLSKWFLPDRVIGAMGQRLTEIVVAALILACVIFIGRWIFRRRREFLDKYLRSEPYFPAVAGMFIPVYIAFLLLTISLFDFGTPLDQRLLWPAFMASLFLMIFTVGSTRNRAVVIEVKLLRMGCLSLLILVFVVSVPRTLSAVAAAHEQGLGYASRQWTESPLMAAVKALPSSTKIYSNGYDAIYSITGRKVYRLPIKRNTSTARVNPLYSRAIRAIGDQLDHADAVVVLFSQIGRSNVPSKVELIAQLALQPVLETPDGVLLRKIIEVKSSTAVSTSWVELLSLPESPEQSEIEGAVMDSPFFWFTRLLG